MHTDALAAVLDGLCATLKETAEAVRELRGRTGEDLPPVLRVKHICLIDGISPATVWRRAKLGEYGDSVISPPDASLRFNRDVFIANRLKRQRRAKKEREEG